MSSGVSPSPSSLESRPPSAAPEPRGEGSGLGGAGGAGAGAGGTEVEAGTLQVSGGQPWRGRCRESEMCRRGRGRRGE